jgi:hypothetical protein
MLRFVKMFGSVLILRRVTTGSMTTNEAHAQVDPRVPCLNAVFTHMLAGLRYFYLIEVRAFLWHSLLLGFLTCTQQSYDFRYVSDETGLQKIDPAPLTMITRGYFICVASRLSLLRVDGRFYNSGRTTVLGRLAASHRQ